jgi:hypothetical protein
VAAEEIAVAHIGQSLYPSGPTARRTIPARRIPVGGAGCRSNFSGRGKELINRSFFIKHQYIKAIFLGKSMY